MMVRDVQFEKYFRTRKVPNSDIINYKQNTKKKKQK